MGMAASQARLLTITARLNHIELESQNLSNAKIRLSDNTQKASDKYIKALNKTEYLYNTYNAKGEMITQDLTGAALTNYGELKNQYGLINSAGQILVSELDGKNFQESNTLEEFLDKYGVLSEPGKGEIVQVTNPEYANAQKEYEKLYNEWIAQKPNPEDEKYQDKVTDSDDSLYQKFTKGTAGGCYTTSMNPCGEGYLGVLHYCDVLEHMLDVGEYTTSDGKKFTISAAGTGPWISVPGGHWWDEGSQKESINNVGGSPVIMEQIREKIAGKYACGKEHGADEEKHMMDCPTSWGGCGGQHELPCDTKEPCDGTQLLTDKIADLFYDFAELFNSGTYVLDLNNPEHQDLYNRMAHLVEHDLKFALEETTEFNSEKYQADLEAWQAKEPQKTDVPMYVDKEVRKVTDSDKAQWYVNLWHRMNGTSDFKGGFGDSAEYDPSEGWASKSKTEQSWAILKDGDMNSPEYLKYAIDNGLITIEQVQFTDPSDADSGLENVAWTSVIFDTITDVTEQKDQIAITKAETEYEQALSDIEAKDKQLDVQMKKLDTEHNALQTEYDSIKGVIEKNVERNFKIFS